MRMNGVGIIGGGLGGLAAACTLAARGHKVTLLEKNPWLGGKAAVLEEGGFRFDMGPTILTMPRVLARAKAQPAARPERAHALEALTPRETEVLRLMCRAANNEEIAERLRMGERTVKSHVSAILAKLGARDRAAAIVAAFDAGFR